MKIGSGFYLNFRKRMFKGRNHIKLLKKIQVVVIKRRAKRRRRNTRPFHLLSYPVKLICSWIQEKRDAREKEFEAPIAKPVSVGKDNAKKSKENDLDVEKLKSKFASVSGSKRKIANSLDVSNFVEGSNETDVNSERKSKKKK